MHTVTDKETDKETAEETAEDVILITQKDIENMLTDLTAGVSYFSAIMDTLPNGTTGQEYLHKLRKFILTLDSIKDKRIVYDGSKNSSIT